jgi:hypothetical protein
MLQSQKFPDKIMTLITPSERASLVQSWTARKRRGVSLIVI